MEKELKELILLAYKNRFSIYHKTGESLVRVYYEDGSQHKETDKTIRGAVNKMVIFLKSQNKF